MTTLIDVADGLYDPERVPGEDELLDAFASWAEEEGRPLWAHQEEAVLALMMGEHVILGTPTGSGKSMVAQALLFKALCMGDKRGYYTAPIKALVNEKYFDLVALFGQENVGMITGDVVVNPEASIICCTAEILAMDSLRWEGADNVGYVVMDEFHFFGDSDRGWAWQVPLLMLPDVQFLLMSATLGDMTQIVDLLERQTGVSVTTVLDAPRPVPLSYEYVETSLEATVELALRAHKDPLYIVHFSQRAALESARSLASFGVADKEQCKAVKAACRGIDFSTAFGKTLQRLLGLGVGVHHAGMLPRYRRTVERLAQLGLLPVICGTDTLGMELLRAHGLSEDAPTVSALSQQWSKLGDAAMPRLHARFLSMFDPVPTMGRFWLLACDGTELALAPDASDDETRMPPAKGGHGRNSCHLTCAFDVARGVFCDMVCQGGRSQDEPGAACELVARCRPPAGLEPLWVLDRGFWSLNLAWRMRESGAHFVCRVKEAEFGRLLRGWLRGLPPAGCGSLDAWVDVCATRSRSAAGRTRPGEPWLYRTVRGRFGGLPGKGPGECWLRLRLVRVGTPGGWLCLATDLPASGAPPSALAAIYRERWGEETAFAELKHTIGLECPHVRTLARVEQECWGRLTLHAACALSAASVVFDNVKVDTSI